MAHLIENNAFTNKAEIAYVGEKPWHGLGQELTKDAPIEVWRKEAGLDWQANISPVLYLPQNEALPIRCPGKNVIYRSDTGASLGVTTNRYQIHQPSDVLDFFNTLVQSAGFSLEVAGAIKGGKRIWALANVNKEACVMNEDAVKGYLLLSTSFDGSTATIGQFSSIRVVCNNTLSAADRETAPSRISLTHGSKFDASLMRDKLGLVVGGFEGMMDNYRALARAKVNGKYVDQFLAKMFPVSDKDVKLKQSRGYSKVLELFEGAGMGADLKGAKGTKWGLLNAVSEHIDHQRGNNVDNRINNAWFGDGNRLKTQAEQYLLA
jgi:phage/plasmid-like protein (TIGR03299 family)